MGFLDFVKKVGRGIASGAKKVLGVGRKAVDGAKKVIGFGRQAINKVRKVPVLGSVLRTPLSAVDGVLQKGEDIANTADDVVRVGESITG